MVNKTGPTLSLIASAGRVEFAPVAYQYPSINDGYDGNWLEMRFTFHLDGRLLSAVSPCLLTTEIEVIRNWIRRPQPQPLKLLEAGLSFDFTNKETLVVTLSWGAIPVEIWVKDCEIAATLDSKHHTLDSVDKVLEEWARTFPVRGTIVA
jgi:hypothetical protein